MAPVIRLACVIGLLAFAIGLPLLAGGERGRPLTISQRAR